MGSNDDSGVPRWAVVSAALAPVAMIGSWTISAAMQDEYDPVRETISWLATSAAVAPAVGAFGFAVTGIAHVVTAAGLRAAPRMGRVLLGVGGLATVGVALAPADRAPRAHWAAATVALMSMATWPLAAWGADGVGTLAPRAGLAATAGLMGMLAWFTLELQHVTPDDGATTGLAERAALCAQALWPLVVVVAARTSATSGTAPTGRSRSWWSWW
ncbi:DUF998 domain-containing protein [Cellulomonas sp. P22]|uniref:DUF998 domain-containing protein n=1 Tax=Cellulomonas sp. P22 TaxID=3373189 RepID=UPI0037B8C218